MNDKEKVVNRLMGCGCEHHSKGCGINSKDCGIIHSTGHYFCSRVSGHTGKHIACGGEGLHNLIEW